MKNEILKVLEQKAKDVKIARTYTLEKELELTIAEFRGMYQMAVKLGIDETELKKIVEIAR